MGWPNGVTTPRGSRLLRRFRVHLPRPPSAVVRVGKLDSDVNGNATNPDEVWAYEGGINYYLREHELRLGLAASLFDYKSSPTKTDVIASAQVSF